MRKIITFLSALSFFSTSTLSVVACGVGNGSEVEIVKNAPELAKNNEDPLKDYVYNNSYAFDKNSVNGTIVLASQLAADKIKDDNGATYTGNIWNDFYKSAGYTEGSYTKFALDNTGLPAGEHDFSYTGAAGQQLFYWAAKDDDAHLDQNKVRVYWFTGSSTAWSPGSSNTYKPTKESLVVPSLNDFNDKTKQIVKQLYLHLYLLIPGFKIDFSAKIDITFQKTTDKNGLSFVSLDPATIEKPFGTINSDDPSPVYNDRISNVTVSYQ